MSRSLRRVALPLAFLFAPLPDLSAQAVLAGTVRQDSGGRPLAGVEVIPEGTNRQTTTDQTGHFVIGGLPYGPRAVLFRMVGFRPVRQGVILLKGDTTRLDVTMVGESAQELPPVEVRTRPDPPRGMGLREGFEERRRLSFGKFIDATVLRANENRRVVDLLRGIPGITFVRRSPSCTGPGRCAPPELWAVSGRTGRIGSECYATIMLDGNIIYRSNDDRDPRGQLRKPPPDWNREFYVSAFEAIEVYRSSAELPIEFSGASGECGVIVLWIRRGR